MGSLIAYSGITTKVKITEHWRIKNEQFLEMAALETVADAVQYLCVFLPYREIFGQVEDKDLYRGNIEQRLNLSRYGDFTKLYQFANAKQRRFLDLYSVHYGITILKTCLRNAAGHREQRRNLFMFRNFFGRHSTLDLITFSQSQSMEEFIGNLKGFVYYEPLYRILQNDRATLSAHETVLGTLYLRSMWEIRDKYLFKNEQRAIAKCFGARTDMLDPQWICRSKRSYQLGPREVCATLILIRLHLTRKETNRMVEAENLDVLYGLVRASWHSRTDLVHLDKDQDLDRLVRDIVDRIYQKASRKGPYSIVVLNSYLYFKEREVERIITIIEKIRYGLGAG